MLWFRTVFPAPCSLTLRQEHRASGFCWKLFKFKTEGIPHQGGNHQKSRRWHPYNQRILFKEETSLWKKKLPLFKEEAPVRSRSVSLNKKLPSEEEAPPFQRRSPMKSRSLSLNKKPPFIRRTSPFFFKEEAPLKSRSLSLKKNSPFRRSSPFSEKKPPWEAETSL